MYVYIKKEIYKMITISSSQWTVNLLKWSVHGTKVGKGRDSSVRGRLKLKNWKYYKSKWFVCVSVCMKRGHTLSSDMNENVWKAENMILLIGKEKINLWNECVHLKSMHTNEAKKQSKIKTKWEYYQRN